MKTHKNNIGIITMKFNTSTKETCLNMLIAMLTPYIPCSGILIFERLLYNPTR